MTKEQKIAKLKKKDVTFEKMSDLIINKLYKEHVLSEEQKIVKKDIDKTTDKYIILLKFVNGILKNIGKDEIDDLTKFVDIDRQDILKEENKTLLISMEKELFGPFDKAKTNYYYKTNAFTFNVLKGMAKCVGLEIRKKRGRVSKNTTVKSYMYYSII